MIIEFWQVGKTKDSFVKDGSAYYEKLIKHFHRFETKTLPTAVGRGINDDISRYKKYEGEAILKQVTPQDFLVILDEKGKTFTSQKFAYWLRDEIDRSHRRMIFLIGGAYGFSAEVYDRANVKIRLSDMTFPHQLVRIIFLEQLYRAFTILRNKSYHH